MIKINEDVLKKAAQDEDLSIGEIEKGVASGHIVVPVNNNHYVEKPCAIGTGLKTKVNANIGLSSDDSNIENEVEKMKVAVKAGADTIMDLSTGPTYQECRVTLLKECPIPVGTVPVYQIAKEAKNGFNNVPEKDFIKVLEKQAIEGVDYFTIHAGINYEATKFIGKNQRIINVVSRGGALMAAWMRANKAENPFLSQFKDVLEILREHNVTLSLGDSLRPGAILDATDRLQIMELLLLGDLQQIALKAGVQTMIEGPGHVPLDQIKENVMLQKSICHGAPFYVLGPLVTDSGMGYDHITSAIGGAIASAAGADYLCYVTPAEHVALPNKYDVHEGVVATKIAAHAGDIVKKLPSSLRRDKYMSIARNKRDWKTMFALSLEPERAQEMRRKSSPGEEDVCTMCGELCSMKVTEESLNADNLDNGNVENVEEKKHVYKIIEQRRKAEAALKE